MINAGKDLGHNMNDMEAAGATIGIGCGMGMWVMIWAAIALPAFIIFVMAKSRWSL